jgi:hypothetical protein
MSSSPNPFPLRGFEPNRIRIPVLESLPDEQLEELNALLAWNCFVVDSSGRRFGQPTSPTKRNVPQEVPDYRIRMLHERLNLADKTVLEIGCFEGVHTVALCQLARAVKACDSRISLVAKTAVRCAMFQVHPTLFVWNVEEPIPEGQDAKCDVLHHVGVLYHLLDPVRHLRTILPQVDHGVMLDTHYADPAAANDSFTSEGRTFRCFSFREGGVTDPYSGMYPSSRWLLLEDVVSLLREFGMPQVDVVERRAERNGPRALIIAHR